MSAADKANEEEGNKRVFVVVLHVISYLNQLDHGKMEHLHVKMS